ERIMEEKMFENRRIAGLAFLILALISNVFTVNAQLTRGLISGTATDASGSVLSGVDITIINEATGFSRATSTNDLGFFRFAAIEPGDYQISFKFAGFDMYRIDRITVGTAQEVTVNAILTV